MTALRRVLSRVDWFTLIDRSITVGVVVSVALLLSVAFCTRASASEPGGSYVESYDVEVSR